MVLILLFFTAFVWTFDCSCQRSDPGRLPETAFPTIQNSVNVVDFSWDPFDAYRLAVGELSHNNKQALDVLLILMWKIHTLKAKFIVYCDLI